MLSLNIKIIYEGLLSIDFPGGPDGKASAYNAGDLSSIPGSGSTLAWKIPWMEHPGGLQSMGLRRVGHD